MSACDGPSTIMTDRILAAKVGQAFLPAGRPAPESLSSSAPSQTGMSAPRTGMSTPSSITVLEAEIDRLVYGLTASEVEIVEG